MKMYDSDQTTYLNSLDELSKSPIKSIDEFYSEVSTNLITAITNVHVIKNSELRLERMYELNYATINILNQIFGIINDNKINIFHLDFHKLTKDQEKIALLFILSTEAMTYFTRRILLSHDQVAKNMSMSESESLYRRQKLFLKLYELGKFLESKISPNLNDKYLTELFMLSDIYRINRESAKNYNFPYYLYCYTALASSFFSLEVLKLLTDYMAQHPMQSSYNSFTNLMRLLNSNLRYFSNDHKLYHQFSKAYTDFLRESLIQSKNIVELKNHFSIVYRDLTTCSNSNNNISLNAFELKGEKSLFLKILCGTNPKTINKANRYKHNI
ncbi:MAG: hypothetical protein N3E37_05710 [Candidatus Micrarchaeota archaeon]|nr:hypothetical protein [Candidatus Micrarchaeota archaeon]